MTPTRLTARPGSYLPFLLLFFPLAVVVWAFWPTLTDLFHVWSSDPQYSHGFLVPPFAAYLLWKSWQAGPVARSPMPVVAGLLLVLALGLRAVAGSLLFQQLDAVSFLLCLAALSLAAGGWPVLRRTGPAILFLIFMIPLPYELERNVGQPLKTAATYSSTFVLQTLGQPAVQDGNLILIDDVKLGVVDACSGLKMMVTFAAFSVGAVLLMSRTRFEKLMVLLGIIPIAIVANVLRIVATGLCFVTFNDKTAHVMHDVNGWLMMPAGLALLGLQLWCLGRLVVRPEAPEVGFAPLRPALA